MTVYTKTGDNGITGTFKGCRVNKNTPLMEVIGTVDELNSLLGVVVSLDEFKGDGSHYPSLSRGVNVRTIIGIQKDLFVMGSWLAGDNKESGIMNYELRIKDLERQIDTMWGKLPPLKNFILPGGINLAANLFLARAVCRRAERRVVGLLCRQGRHQPDKNGIIIMKYLNRLSDYLFVLGRYVNFLAKEKEIVWTT